MIESKTEMKIKQQGYFCDWILTAIAVHLIWLASPLVLIVTSVLSWQGRICKATKISHTITWPDG